MAYVALNFGASTLASGINASDTTINVQTGHGALFAVGSNYSYLVLENTSGNTEIVKITGQTGDALTVVRAQDGTTARSWVTGNVIECRPCAAAIADILAEATTAGTSAVSSHLSDPTAAHAASAISYAGSAGLVATDVEAALDELDTEKRNNADDVLLPAGKSIVFEGVTDDAFETTLTAGDPTADRTIALPDNSGTVALVSDTPQLQPISASAAGNALTISAGPLVLDFRSATAGSGAVTRVSGTPANLVLSAGSTLGLTAGQLGRVAVVAMNNGGTIELAVSNMAGGLDVSENGLISTTAEGGAGGADSANVWYSTTARTNLPYRFLGYLEGTWATPGQWTAPSGIQGAGGQGTAFSALGYGRSWQSVSRTAGTTYYNNTGRFITLLVAASGPGPIAGVMHATINGLTMQIGGMFQGSASTLNFSGQIEIPPGAAYSYSCNVPCTCYELR